MPLGSSLLRSPAYAGGKASRAAFHAPSSSSPRDGHELMPEREFSLAASPRQTPNRSESACRGQQKEPPIRSRAATPRTCCNSRQPRQLRRPLSTRPRIPATTTTPSPPRGPAAALAIELDKRLATTCIRLQQNSRVCQLPSRPLPGRNQRMQPAYAMTDAPRQSAWPHIASSSRGSLPWAPLPESGGRLCPGLACRCPIGARGHDWVAVGKRQQRGADEPL